MLTPEYYDKCTRQLIALYAELDNAIISDITRRLLKTGEMTETAQWQAKQLQESGMVYDDILNEISRRTGTSQAEIKRIFEEAGVTATMNDNEFAKAAGFKEIRTFSKAALQTLNAGYVKCAGDMNNLTLTTANASQQLYINAVNNAYMQIMSGAFDYNTAIRNAVRAAAADGAEVIYPSGHRDKIDVAVRRSVLTGVGQTCRKLSEINAQDMGTDLMEITAHAGARPSHAEWQGRIVSLSGRKGYLSPKDIGYGTGDGFGGWNCRHDWYPYFEGKSRRAYTDERLEALNAKNIKYDGEMYSEYEISQMQRKMERSIRQLKREAVAYDTGIQNADNEELANKFTEDFTDTSVRLKAEERKLKEFLNETGQLPDSSRVWSNGFDRKVSQKAVVADKKAFVKSMKEKGIKNPPKSIAEFEKMMYTNPKEYYLMESYIKSVDSGMLSPLAGYEKYREYYERIENEVVGVTAADGTVIKSQSKHFLERVFGTVSDPSHGGVKRSGVKLDDVIDCIKNGKYISPKNPEKIKSVVLATDKCLVSINPETGNLIQTTPQ